jgi:hypothetical protein
MQEHAVLMIELAAECRLENSEHTPHATGLVVGFTTGIEAAGVVVLMCFVNTCTVVDL